jgi:hypothetical protein
MRKAIILTSAVLVCCVKGYAQTSNVDSPTEYQVKAAFLYNFAKFVQWPANAFRSDSSAIIIGILGKDPFGHDLDRMLATENLHGRRFLVLRLRDDQDLKICHILFITPFQAMQRWPKIGGDLEGASVLTIGENEQFAKDGGMIRFVMTGNKVGFEINLETVRKARLQISSRLLRLATNVISPAGEQ